MARQSAILGVIAAILASSASAQSRQPGLTVAGDPSARIVWQRVLASPGDDWVNDVVRLRDGSFLAVGFLDRADGDPPSDWRSLAARIAEDGTISTREYGAGGGTDAFWTAIETGGGRIAFAGFTTRFGAGGIDGWVLIAGPDGTMLSERAFGGGGYDRFTGAAPAGDGFVFLGHSQAEGERVKRRVFVVRTDAAGLPVWERIIEGPESLGALYIEPAGDGGFIVSGGISSGEESDLLVLKLDSEGKELWRRMVGAPGTPDVNHGLVVRPDGTIVVVGYSKSWGARDNDILAATLSPAGKVLRREMLGGAGDDRPILAKAGPEGRIWIVGRTSSAGAGEADLVATSLDSRGSFEGGAITIGGPLDDIGTAIRPLADGSLLVAGYSRNLGQGGEDAFVARVSKPSRVRNLAFERRVITD
jgi:hypothetical protein